MFCQFCSVERRDFIRDEIICWKSVGRESRMLISVCPLRAQKWSKKFFSIIYLNWIGPSASQKLSYTVCGSEGHSHCWAQHLVLHLYGPSVSTQLERSPFPVEVVQCMSRFSLRWKVEDSSNNISPLTEWQSSASGCALVKQRLWSLCSFYVNYGPFVCSGVHKLVKKDGHTEEKDAGKMMAVCLCVYVWHRWNDFSGITVWLGEQRGGNCILITVLMVLCRARWKLLYRYTQNKSALCCSSLLSPQQRYSLSLSFSLSLPLICFTLSLCLFNSVSPDIQYIC